MFGGDEACSACGHLEQAEPVAQPASVKRIPVGPTPISA